MARRLILRSSLIALFAVLLLGSMPALADDLFAPPWRGNDGTTYAEWQFFAPGSEPFDPVIPDDWVGPGDAPLAYPAPGLGQEYWDEWGGRNGVWPLSGEIIIEVPNYDIPNPLKEIWIQITWAQQAPLTGPVVSATADEGFWVGDAELINEIVLEPTNEPTPAGENWIHSTYRIFIWPNPDFETIIISGAIMVDQVVVDTWCTVPEPATLSLLGVAGLAILLQFRRKR